MDEVIAVGDRSAARAPQKFVSAVVLIVFVLSGFAGLAYQLVWTKHLMLIFGVSHQAISTVLASFMAGLAIGSIVLGRLADRVRHPLRLYAVLELGIGVSAALLPVALSLVNDAYISLARSAPAHSWVFALGRFLLCFAVVLVPTTLMGGTLPAMSRQFIRRSDGVGVGAGLLYGANTVGGVLGAAATGFYLLRVLGAYRTTLLGVGINVAVAVIALLLSLRAEPAPLRQPERAGATPTAPTDARRWLGAFVLLAFALAGAASLAYEVLWTRVLIYFMDLTIYSLTTILIAFLTGLALGSFAFARLADRSRNLLLLFGAMELAIAVSALYLLHTMGKLLLFSASLLNWLGSSEYVSLVVARLASACIFILLPTFIMGGVFPVVTRLFTRDLAALGRSLGDLYGANTIGCVIGSLAAGFVLLQLVGAQQAIGVVAVINGTLGIACVLLSAEPRRVLMSAAGTALVGVGVVLAWRAAPAVLYSDRVVATGSELIFYREGPEASLAVLRTPLGDREINLNGTSTAYTDYADIVAHKLLAHPPALLAEDPRSALIIGFGMGSTAWSFAQYPLERIDCVELVPAERETADLFLPENGGILSDPRFQLIIGDGRNYLLTTPVNYDIISFNAIHPAFSPYLYTREFYELCRSRLTEEGVLCAWIPSNSTYFPSLLRTFQETFPHTSLWYANIGHLALIATPEPLRVDLQRLRDRMSPAPLHRNLAETHLEHPLRLVSDCIMDENAICRYVADTRARTNTDDLPYVEFDTTTDLKGSAIANTESLLPYCTSTEELIDISALAAGQRTEVREQAQSYGESTRLGIESAIQAARGDLNGALLTLDKAAMTCPGDTRIQFMLAKLLADIRWTRASPGGGAAWYSERAPGEIARVLEEQADGAGGEPGVPERYLLSMRLALARMLFREGDLEGTAAQLHRVLATDPHNEAGRRFLQDLEDFRARGGGAS